MRRPFKRSGSLWVPSRREMLGALGVGLLAPRNARAATFSPLAHAGGGCGPSSPQTTAAIDSSGADLLILGLVWDSSSLAGDLIDSKGNTWTALTSKATPMVQIWYCKPSTVGSGHTVTVDNHTGGGLYLSAYLAAFSGSSPTPFDLENGANNTATSPGSITPSQSNELVIAVASSGSSAPTVDANMTLLNNNAVSGGTYWGGGMAYRIQITAAAINPVWAGSAACVIASFKSASSGSGGAPVRHRVISGGE
jgi:hypothetical protein